jgi:hypothetical protein
MLDLHFDLSAQPEYIQMTNMAEAGLVDVYENRNEALAVFREYLKEEKGEIFVIGSSLKGLLLNKENADVLKDRIKANVRLRFLLTHPAVADLRADQEGIEFKVIGEEIIKSLELLEQWRIPVNNVRLYKGAPTIFAIKTTDQMLLNPYTYTAVAYDSPCFISDRRERQNPYLYDWYDTHHFGAWNSAELVHNYKRKIEVLRKKLSIYEIHVADVLTEDAQ